MGVRYTRGVRRELAPEVESHHREATSRSAGAPGAPSKHRHPSTSEEPRMTPSSSTQETRLVLPDELKPVDGTVRLRGHRRCAPEALAATGE